MVRAGMKKKRVQYANIKKALRLACPTRNTSEPNSQVKNPLIPRNRTSRMYAIRESKNDRNSLFVSIQMVFMAMIFSLDQLVVSSLKISSSFVSNGIISVRVHLFLTQSLKISLAAPDPG
jgi:hypothetical protein